MQLSQLTGTRSVQSVLLHNPTNYEQLSQFDLVRETDGLLEAAIFQFKGIPTDQHKREFSLGKVTVGNDGNGKKADLAALKYEDQNGKVDFLIVEFGAKAFAVNGGLDAELKANMSILDVQSHNAPSYCPDVAIKLGVGLNTGIKCNDETLGVQIFGTGFMLGKTTGISLFGSGIAFNFEKFYS